MQKKPTNGTSKEAQKFRTRNCFLNLLPVASFFLLKCSVFKTKKLRHHPEDDRTITLELSPPNLQGHRGFQSHTKTAKVEAVCQ